MWSSRSKISPNLILNHCQLISTEFYSLRFELIMKISFHLRLKIEIKKRLELHFRNFLNFNSIKVQKVRRFLRGVNLNPRFLLENLVWIIMNSPKRSQRRIRMLGSRNIFIFSSTGMILWGFPPKEFSRDKSSRNRALNRVSRLNGLSEKSSQLLSPQEISGMTW